MNKFSKLSKVILLLSVGLGISESLKAQESRSVLEFLNLPSSAFSMAMGGVNVSLIANEPLLAIDNPALFGKEHDRQLSISYSNYIGKNHYGNALYSQAVGERSAFAIATRYYSYGSLEKRDIMGNYLGNFSSNNIALQGSFSYELSDYIRAGATLKTIYSNISEYSAWGIAVDLGLNYYSENKDTSIAVSLLNAGAMLNAFDKDKETMPWDIRVGFSQKLDKAPFAFHITAYDLHPERHFRKKMSIGKEVLRHFIFGMQYIPSRSFYLSFGYNPKLAQDINLNTNSKLAGFSAGFAFMTKQFRISLATTNIYRSNFALMSSFSWDFSASDRSF